MSVNLQDVEREIENNKTEIELDQALTRLFSNKDFQDIIVGMYMTEEPARLVKLRSAPHIQADPNQLKMIDNAITGIGALFQFLNAIDMAGQTAAHNLRTNEEARQEMLEEVA